jgi:hypothetical protein
MYFHILAAHYTGVRIGLIDLRAGKGSDKRVDHHRNHQTIAAFEMGRITDSSF